MCKDCEEHRLTRQKIIKSGLDIVLNDDDLNQLGSDFLNAILEESNDDSGIIIHHTDTKIVEVKKW